MSAKLAAVYKRAQPAAEVLTPEHEVLTQEREVPSTVDFRTRIRALAALRSQPDAPKSLGLRTRLKT